MNQIYSIKTADSDKVTLNLVWTQDGKNQVAAGYTSMVPVKMGNDTVLFAYNKTTQKTDAYELYDKDPWVKLKKSDIDLAGHPLDTLDTFVLGNNPYLLAYTKDTGTFGIYQIANDLTVSKPYLLRLTRLTPTDGFTTIAPFTSLGQQYFLGYDFDKGTVTNFKLEVETSSDEGVPPLRASNIWYHQWAKNWTHFTFFTLGGATFFFKINTGKLNVNIDHIQDDPSKGSVEVGSHLQNQLPDALSINIVKKIPWDNNEPLLLTYIDTSGSTDVYRIHVDCQGWTKVGNATTQEDVSMIVPYRIGSNSYALFY